MWRRFFDIHARSFTAALIALTSLTGALVAWRAAVADGAAGGADREGLDDLTARQHARAVAQSDAEAFLADVVTVHALQARADRLRAEAEEAEGDDAARLALEAEALAAAAEDLEQTINPDALLPSGQLALDRTVDLALAVAAQQQDLDPAPEFAEADRKRRKSERLVGLSALLIAAALFFTLAQISRTRARTSYVVVGLVVFGLATNLAFVIEFSS